MISVLKLPKIQSSCRDYPLIAYLKMNVEQLGKGNVIYYNNGNDSNLLIVFYVQIMPDDLVMQLHR
ncbi:hypothetical protein, partial [Escherichia coli]|uniref:hypothetical protein n=1 Tax=Escherichia coli TaxID=562 RepID=UPI0020238A6D